MRGILTITYKSVSARNTVVAFTREYSRVSISTGNVSVIKESQVHPMNSKDGRQRGYLWPLYWVEQDCTQVFTILLASGCLTVLASERGRRGTRQAKQGSYCTLVDLTWWTT